MSASSFVKTMTVTADSPPAAIDLSGVTGPFILAIYNGGSHGASIVFSDSASSHTGYFFGAGTAAETDGWADGDVANGLWLYADNATDCFVTIRQVV